MIHVKRHSARDGLMLLRAGKGDRWGDIVFRGKGLYFVAYDGAPDNPLLWMKTTLGEGEKLLKLLSKEG